MCQVQRNERPS